jgi:HEAT repeat protein
MLDMNSEFEQLVGKFPQPADDGKLAELDRQEMMAATEQLAKHGGSAVVALVEMLVDAGEGGDTQVRHALHALATYAAGMSEGQPRGEIVRALLKSLEGDQSDEVKSFIVRQVQVCGGTDAVEELGKLLTDARLCESAAQALLAIGGTGAQFRQALPMAKKGKAARLTIVQALGVLHDAEAADALREAARDEDADMRQAALWGLANLGQLEDVGLLINAANAAGFERLQATKSCLILAERLLAAGQKDVAERVYRHLRETRDDSEGYVREAADRGLAAVR